MYEDELIYLNFSGVVDKELEHKYVFTYKGIETTEKTKTTLE